MPYEYNNCIHKSTKFKLVVLFKGIDNEIFNLSRTGNQTDIEIVRTRLSDYCLKFKTEYENRVRMDIEISLNQNCLVAYPYNLRKLLAGPHVGFYENEEYVITQIFLVLSE